MAIEWESFPTCRHAKMRLESGVDTLAVACICTRYFYDYFVQPLPFRLEVVCFLTMSLA